MSLSSSGRSAQLLLRLIDPKSATIPMMKPLPPKPQIPRHGAFDTLPRHTPEKHGIPSAHIQKFLQTLQQDPTLRMHSILIVRDGCVICEAGFAPHDTTLPRMTFSACKSIVSLACGILIDDGLLHLSDHITDFFPREGSPVKRQIMKDLTIKDLLCMQAANQFNEIACMTEPDWLKGYFASPGLAAADKFHYNSLNTYILGRIIALVSGSSLSNFLRQRLFDPMGIRDFYWEPCPNGFEKGGWGLYMRPEDLAKLGQLVLQGGMWNGTQLVSYEYLQQATSPQVLVPDSYGAYHYGLHFWTGKHNDCVLFNGMLGQNVMCFRNNGIVIVSHAGNDETFQQSSYYKIAATFFGGSFLPTLPRDPDARQALRKQIRTLAYSRGRMPDKSLLRAFCGKQFVTDALNAPSIGLLPVTLQALQNYYTSGLIGLAISGTQEQIKLTYRENGCSYQILAGTKKPYVQTLSFGKNQFLTAAQVRIIRNEDNCPVLRLQLDFLETPFTRIIKLILTPKGLLLQQSETPCMEQLLPALLNHTPPVFSLLLSNIPGISNPDFLNWRMSLVFSPEIYLQEKK